MRRPALAAAATGAIVGLIVCPIVWGWSGAWVMVLLGAFFGWWLWLFGRALRADQTIRWLSIPGLLAIGVLIFILERPNPSGRSDFAQTACGLGPW